MVHNLQRARQKWARLTQVLIREVADSFTSEQIYLAVVQLVLIYGSETWFLTPLMQRVLGRFHHRLARILMGRKPRKGRYGGWFYPPLKYATAEAGLQEVETYIYFSHNTVAEYIATRPIIDLCMLADRRLGQE